MCAKYAWGTSVGTDGWQPRALGLLPIERLAELLRMGKVWITRGVMPEQLTLLLIHLIPKPMDEGERPIAVFVRVARIVGRSAS